MGSADTPASKQSRKFHMSTPVLSYRDAYLNSQPIETSAILEIDSLDHQISLPSQIEVIDEESFNDSSLNISDLQQSIFEETLSRTIDLKHRRRGFYISQELIEITRIENSSIQDDINNESEKTIVQEDERVEESPTPSANNTSGENLKKNPIFSLDLSDKFASLRDQFSHRWKFLQNRSIERVAQKEQNHKEHFSNDDEYFEKDNEQGVDSTPSETDVSQLELINKRQRKSVKSKSASLGATSKRIIKDKNQKTIKRVAKSIYGFSPSPEMGKFGTEKNVKELREKRKSHLNPESEHRQKKKKVILGLVERDDESSACPVEKRYRRINHKRLESTDSAGSPSYCFVNDFRCHQQSARPLKSNENIIKYSVEKSKDRRRKKTGYSESTSADDESFDDVRKESEFKLMGQKPETSSSQVDNSAGQVSTFYKYIAWKRQQEESSKSMNSTVDVNDSINTKFLKGKSKKRW